MKRQKLLKALNELGCSFFREGGNHEIWERPDGAKFPIPRHTEINENLAKDMIKMAKKTSVQR